jgi:DNA-binding MarR family transcriptional regulator
MPDDPSLTDFLERIVLAGVGLTSHALAEAAPGIDLTLSQWRVLVVLGDTTDGATVSSVAGQIGVTLPATSRQLRRLERRGLVELGPDERDHRATRARLTPAGRRARDAILAYRRARISAVADRFRPPASTLRDLARFADALDETTAPH